MPRWSTAHSSSLAWSGGVPEALDTWRLHPEGQSVPATPTTCTAEVRRRALAVREAPVAREAVLLVTGIQVDGLVIENSRAGYSFTSPGRNLLGSLGPVLAWARTGAGRSRAPRAPERPA